MWGDSADGNAGEEIKMMTYPSLRGDNGQMVKYSRTAMQCQGYRGQIAISTP